MAQSISLSNLSKSLTNNRWWLKLLRQISFYIILLLAWEGLARAGVRGNTGLSEERIGRR